MSIAGISRTVKAQRRCGLLKIILVKYYGSDWMTAAEHTIGILHAACSLEKYQMSLVSFLVKIYDKAAIL